MTKMRPKPPNDSVIASEMIRYFRNQTSDFDEQLLMRALMRLESEGFKADELEFLIQTFSEEERSNRFSARFHVEMEKFCSSKPNAVYSSQNEFVDLKENEFRYVLLKDDENKKMLLVAGRTQFHAELPRPEGTKWVNSGGGFITFNFSAENELEVVVFNRSWNSAVVSETTENYSCIRACLENHFKNDSTLSGFNISIAINSRNEI